MRGPSLLVDLELPTCHCLWRSMNWSISSWVSCPNTLQSLSSMSPIAEISAPSSTSEPNAVTDSAFDTPALLEETVFLLVSFFVYAWYHHIRTAVQNQQKTQQQCCMASSCHIARLLHDGSPSSDHTYHICGKACDSTHWTTAFVQLHFCDGGACDHYHFHKMPKHLAIIRPFAFFDNFGDLRIGHQLLKVFIADWVANGVLELAGAGSDHTCCE